MTILTQYEQIDREHWQTLITDSSTATWFQTPEAYDFFAAQPDLFTPFVVAVHDAQCTMHDGLRAVCVGYVTQERNALKQFFTRRAIIIGGPALANDCTQEEVTTLMQSVASFLQGKSWREAPIYIETRNFNDYSQWREGFEKGGFEYKPHLNFHVDCTSTAQIEAAMSECRLRQIRKAIRNGVVIEEAKSLDEVRQYFAILRHLYRTKVKVPLFPFEFFQIFFEGGYGKYLLVKKDNEILGGIMCPVFGARTIYEWFVCGKDVEHKTSYPSVMATYAAIQYAAENHIATFDFMGAGKPNEPYGVREFKAEFGGQLVEHGRYICLCVPLLYKIGEIGVKILKKI